MKTTEQPNMVLILEQGLVRFRPVITKEAEVGGSAVTITNNIQDTRALVYEETDRQRQTDRQTDIEREAERDREGKTETETERQSETQRERERNTLFILEVTIN